MPSSACASSIPSRFCCCARARARVLRRRQYQHAGARHPCTQGQLLQVHQRDAQRHRGRDGRRACDICVITAPRRAAATSSRWRAMTSSWSTTAPRRCRCRSCRCWRCCPAPAGSPASPTSARCGATMPTCSAPPRKASRASARSIGGWSTRWCRGSKFEETVPKRAKRIRRPSHNRARPQCQRHHAQSRSSASARADAVDYSSSRGGARACR